MRIAIVSDAWRPQVNGVVRTLETTAAVLEDLGHETRVFSPHLFRSLPCPTYPEIPLALFPGRKLARELRQYAPDAVHIATEGPVGLAARNHCLHEGLAFTTSYHTRFPEYVRLRLPVPLTWSYRYLRWFHGPAARTMVATPSMAEDLRDHRFRHLATWSRGVDTELFRPRLEPFYPDTAPIFLYVGRVAVEKNIEAFLGLDLPGTKYVVGDGPALDELRGRHPEARFVGYKSGDELASHVAGADVMVFPSLTDTFGLVILEANASGVPVAAFPVTGPKDLIVNGRNGVLSDDLRAATLAALEIDPASCREFAERYSWRACTQQFLANLEPNGDVDAPIAQRESA
jgi:glycosyltransferase involved in cell wall biosynthesis